MTHDVFISYSTKDKLVADAMCSIFENSGIRCWIAPRDILPGGDWGASIIDAISDSQVLVLILSANSNASEQVKREVERAVSKSIVIIPFRIEDVQLSKTLEYHLSVTHWMDALSPPVENHIQLLVDKIRPLLPAKQTDDISLKQQKSAHAKAAAEKLAQEKPQQASESAKENHQAIEEYFYDLAKEKRISKDILLAVLEVLEKEQSQLSALEQQQYVLTKEAFGNTLNTVEFIRKWDRLSYEIKNAKRIALELRERERLEQEMLVGQKKNEEEKAAREKEAQKKREQQKIESEQLEQKKLAEQKNRLAEKEAEKTDRKNAPAIWNPKVIVCWTVLFSPIFGSYLQMLNWRALGEPEKAAEAKDSFYSSIFFVIVYGVLSLCWPLFFSLPADVFFDDLDLYRNRWWYYVWLCFLGGWFKESAKPQIQYVKSNFGSSYPRRGWKKPLLIGFLVVLPLEFAQLKLERIIADSQIAAEMVPKYQQYAKEGDSTAQTVLGHLYEKGEGVEKDNAKALKWYRKAAEHGDALAQNNLGIMYLDGRGVEKDNAKAVEWVRKAAEQDMAVAQYSLGEMYRQGKGVEKNYSEAISWFNKAIEQDSLNAQNSLGMMYLKGEGVEKDNAKALELIRKAAEQGHSAAQNNLGNMYDNGEGVEKDDVKAVEWYRKAAEKGHSLAQNNLGIMYYNGEGVEKDNAKAVEWLRKAAEQGNEDAKKALKQLKK